MLPLAYPSRRGPALRRMHRDHFGTSLCQHARIDFITVFTLAPQLSFLPLVLQPILAFPNSGLEILSLITLLGSNLGTKSYVLRSLWNLLLSNLRLFSPGYTLSSRFLSPGAHAESRSHVRREPRHVPTPQIIPGGEHSLTPGTIPH
jgi:hypothetical protein